MSNVVELFPRRRRRPSVVWVNTNPEPHERVEQRRRDLRGSLSFALTDEQWMELWGAHDALAACITEGT